jgi:hypothetical protein
MTRPVFLSYAWDDAAEVDELDTLLRLRGVPVWRDRREMQFGGYNENLVCRTILEDIAGFALYLTPAAIEDSWFIPKVELRAMDRRRNQDDAFFAGAIFRGYSVQAGKQAVFDATGVDMGATLGAPVEEANLLAGLRDAANSIRIELAPTFGGVLVGDRSGDLLLEPAGAAFSEVDVHVFAVEGRDGGDEPAAVSVDDLGGLAVVQLVDADAVAWRAGGCHGPRGSLVAVAGRRSMLLGVGSVWRSRSVSSAIGQVCCWRAVRITLISVC